MFYKGFEVSISGKQEDEAGYVRMTHEEEYIVSMRNNTPHECDAELIIDGTTVGEFRIGPRRTVRVERPSHEARKFTFLEINSFEADMAGLHDVSPEDLGLVQVVFKPEIIRQQKPIKRPIKPHLYAGQDANFSITECSANLTRGAGGTGLGEHSNQEFYEVPSLTTRREDWVRISLRLTSGGKYKSLRENSTKIPPPIA